MLKFKGIMSCILLILVLPMTASKAASVAFQSNGLQVNVGENFDIPILASGFSELAGGNIDFGFDPRKLSVNNVTVDPLWDFEPESGGLGDTGSWRGIAFDVFQNDPAAGDAVIATVNFTALEGGDALLNIFDSSRFFSIDELLSPELGRARLNISSVPLPPALWLMALGLLAIRGLTRTKTD